MRRDVERVVLDVKARERDLHLHRRELEERERCVPRHRGSRGVEDVNVADDPGARGDPDRGPGGEFLDLARGLGRLRVEQAALADGRVEIVVAVAAFPGAVERGLGDTGPAGVVRVLVLGELDGVDPDGSVLRRGYRATTSSQEEEEEEEEKEAMRPRATGAVRRCRTIGVDDIHPMRETGHQRLGPPGTCLARARHGADDTMSKFDDLNPSSRDKHFKRRRILLSDI